MEVGGFIHQTRGMAAKLRDKLEKWALQAILDPEEAAAAVQLCQSLAVEFVKLEDDHSRKRYPQDQHCSALTRGGERLCGPCDST